LNAIILSANRAPQVIKNGDKRYNLSAPSHRSIFWVATTTLEMASGSSGKVGNLRSMGRFAGRLCSIQKKMLVKLLPRMKTRMVFLPACGAMSRAQWRVLRGAALAAE